MLLPFQRSDKEYESYIGSVRASRGLTIADLSRMSGVSQSVISGLNNGMISPIALADTKNNKEGDWKWQVHKISKVLDVDAEYLFPRYACRIHNSQILDEQVAGFLHNHSSTLDPEQIYEKNQELSLVDEVLSRLTCRHEKVLRMFFLGYENADIAKELRLSQGNVQNIKTKAKEAFIKKWNIFQLKLTD